MPDKPLVSIVILSYNRPELLVESLKSVLAQSYQPIEILVVDNLSPRSPEIRELLQSFPQIYVIANTENLGFTGGMNVGLKQAKGDWIYLSEDDVLLEPSYLQTLMDVALQRPDASLLAGMQRHHKSGLICCVGGRVRLGGIFEYRLHLENAPMSERPTDPQEVQFIPGSMMLATRSTWETFQGFDNAYFMYMEDIELCQRIMKSGKKIIVVPKAIADHFEPKPHSGKVNQLLAYHRYKNLLRTYLLHGDAAVLPIFTFRYVIWYSIKMVVQNPQGLGPILKAWGFNLWNLWSTLGRRRQIQKLGTK